MASVGPYASIMIRPGAAHRCTSSGGQASPATTRVIDSRCSAGSIATAVGVRQNADPLGDQQIVEVLG